MSSKLWYTHAMKPFEALRNQCKEVIYILELVLKIHAPKQYKDSTL